MILPRPGFRGPALIGLVLVLAAGCSSATKDGATARQDPPPVATTVAPDPHATVASEQEVDPSFRQGLAKTSTGWVFSTNNALFVTDEALTITAKLAPAIPPEWAAQGFDHIGDVDVADGVIYAPLEQPDYGKNRQAMLRYDLATLAYIDGVPVTQSHNSWVAVDPDAEVAYSMNTFDDQAVVRYDLTDGWKPMDPVPLDLALGHVQGGDLPRRLPVVVDRRRHRRGLPGGPADRSRGGVGVGRPRRRRGRGHRCHGTGQRRPPRRDGGRSRRTRPPRRPEGQLARRDRALRPTWPI